jgi:hypothetical protein
MSSSKKAIVDGKFRNPGIPPQGGMDGEWERKLLRLGEY